MRNLKEPPRDIKSEEMDEDMYMDEEWKESKPTLIADPPPEINPFRVNGMLIKLSTIGGVKLPTREWVEYACTELNVGDLKVNGILIRQYELFEELCTGISPGLDQCKIEKWDPEVR